MIGVDLRRDQQTKKHSTERDSETNDLYRKQLKESTMQFQYQHGIAKLVINQ